jgi:hypothetical protein
MMGAVAQALQGDPATLQQVLDAALGGAGAEITIGSVTGLTAALAGKQPAGSYAADPHGHALGEIAGLVAALAAKQDAGSFQPLDSDLTALAALTTTSFGRSFLALADAAAGQSLGLARRCSRARRSSARQPLDSDLTAIAALATTASPIDAAAGQSLSAYQPSAFHTAT